MATKLPTYGAKNYWTFVKLRGHVLPVIASDDQFCVQFPDGTTVWIEKWECETAFPQFKRPPGRLEELKDEAKRRAKHGHRNSPSTTFDIDMAFVRNAGKFED